MEKENTLRTVLKVSSHILSLLSRMGAGGMDYRQLSQQIELTTGSFGASNLVTDHHTLSNVYEEVRGLLQNLWFINEPSNSFI